MRWRPPLVVVIGVAISASITTVFLRRVPATAPRAEETASALPATAPPPLAEAPPTSESAILEFTAAREPSPVQAPTPIQDVGWLLVGIPDNGPPERWPGIAEKIQSAHERLVQMSDDPVWSRRTESALRGALTSIPMENLEVTSVVCRAGGCEAQAVLLDPEAMSRRLPRFPPPMSEANPLPDLSMDATERSLLGDRWGIYLSYRRVE